MRCPTLVAFVLSGLLAACATPYEKGVARMDAAIDARLSNAIGGTVADFIAQTRAHPKDFYDRGSDRVFVFDGGVCRIRLTAQRVGMRDAPGDWRVVDVDHAGRCEQIVAD